ncbi:hypothetical protein OG739_05150 [Streptomyces longwoodensis]|uniref:Secreted protein n=1 Tax=Streptomyces lasalocidi TaxID=324833 RepID=A0A4U5WC43_STRLS|nr:MULTISPECIES: hypothetical protein [Streptomyces]MCX4999899.1 hypothetical protein [Streptomyces longwoodensis]TKS99326.1 hypothetical protein E4U91_03790 [Streptomyces lasalocidi]WTI48627.1 hypothetical protein OG547_30915 [Streptomyces longwoodensis]WUC61356.1 hypothetical protein OHA09_31800 [Streptomyces longwoodensis]WUC74901.1 hypothetical protein OG416_30880 [Streptomyces longwoodensis]
MTDSRLLVRSGLTVAVAAALPLVLTADPAAARVQGISVSTVGTTVSVVTSACTTQTNGTWGTGSLLSSGQTTFAQGRQVALSGTSVSQSAAWSNVSPGTYTVIVTCANGTTAGTQSVIVSAPVTRTPTPTASASRGVMGGSGGSVHDYGTLTLAAGGTLVGAGVIAAAWFLRRRSKPYRL